MAARGRRLFAARDRGRVVDPEHRSGNVPKQRKLPSRRVKSV
jgi:hypothetical protein